MELFLQARQRIARRWRGSDPEHRGVDLSARLLAEYAGMPGLCR